MPNCPVRSKCCENPFNDFGNGIQPRGLRRHNTCSVVKVFPQMKAPAKRLLHNDESDELTAQAPGMRPRPVGVGSDEWRTQPEHSLRRRSADYAQERQTTQTD